MNLTEAEKLKIAIKALKKMFNWTDMNWEASDYIKTAGLALKDLGEDVDVYDDREINDAT